MVIRFSKDRSERKLVADLAPITKRQSGTRAAGHAALSGCPHVTVDPVLCRAANKLCDGDPIPRLQERPNRPLRVPIRPDDRRATAQARAIASARSARLSTSGLFQPVEDGADTPYTRRSPRWSCRAPRGRFRTDPGASGTSPSILGGNRPLAPRSGPPQASPSRCSPFRSRTPRPRCRPPAPPSRRSSSTSRGRARSTRESWCGSSTNPVPLASPRFAGSGWSSVGSPAWLSNTRMMLFSNSGEHCRPECGPSTTVHAILKVNYTRSITLPRVVHDPAELPQPADPLQHHQSARQRIRVCRLGQGVVRRGWPRDPDRRGRIRTGRTLLARLKGRGEAPPGCYSKAMSTSSRPSTSSGATTHSAARSSTARSGAAARST